MAADVENGSETQGADFSAKGKAAERAGMFQDMAAGQNGRDGGVVSAEKGDTFADVAEVDNLTADIEATRSAIAGFRDRGDLESVARNEEILRSQEAALTAQRTAIEEGKTGVQ